MMKPSPCSRFFAIVLATTMAPMAFCQRVGDLVVTPTRVNIDDTSRSGSITVVNRSSQTVRYRLNLVDMEMSVDGILRRIPGGTPNSAAPILRLSPREIVLEPGASQRIKILAVMPADLREGELRSHLSFEPIKKETTDSSQSDGQSLKIRIETRAVVTIPVIVAHGRVAASTALTNAIVQKGASGWFASFNLHRTGNRTVRGDITVSFKPAGGGKTVPLAQITAMPVYYPNSQRNVQLPLALDLSSLGKGEIEFKFLEAGRSKGAATARLLIPAPG